MTAAIRSTAALVLVLSSFFLSSCLGIGGGSSNANPSPTPPQKAHASTKAETPLGVYLTTEAALSAFANPAAAQRAVTEWKQRGVEFILLQARDEARTVALFAGAGPEQHRQEILTNALQAGRKAKVRIVPVQPVFLGQAEGSKPLQQLHRDGTVGPLEWPVRRTNSLDQEARTAELAALQALASARPSAICLSHVGFPSLATDVSPLAQQSFEEFLGRSVASWPSDVREGGELRGEWLRWRAADAAAFLVEATRVVEAAAPAGSRPVPVLWMGNGYFPLHAEEGVNWSRVMPKAPTFLPNAPSNYGATGIGDVLDGLVLELGAPVPTFALAKQEGLEPWAAAEVALDGARSVLPEKATIWTALPLSPYHGSDNVLEGEEARRFIEAVRIAQSKSQVVVLLEPDLIEAEGLWELLAPRPEPNNGAAE